MEILIIWHRAMEILIPWIRAIDGPDIPITFISSVLLPRVGGGSKHGRQGCHIVWIVAY
jgi:hypothetical protein